MEWMDHLSRFTSVMSGAQCSMAGSTVGGCWWGDRLML